jgi:5,6-dimethylbenzimidazole synthase
MTLPAPVSGDGFRTQLAELFRWRRNARQLVEKPVPASLLRGWVDVANLAPSVGLSQP